MRSLVAPRCSRQAACCLTPQTAHAQAGTLTPIFEDPDPLVAHASPSGYLGVEVTDVDADKAQALKLKEVRGAVIMLIDHDAPAGQIGLKVNDVVLAINGQNVDGGKQFVRMLHEIPPGRKISLEVSRDGNIQTLAVQLVDRKAMEQSIWSRIGMDVDGISPAAPVPAIRHHGRRRCAACRRAASTCRSSPARSTWAPWLSRLLRRWPSISASRAA